MRQIPFEEIAIARGAGELLRTDGLDAALLRGQHGDGGRPLERVDGGLLGAPGGIAFVLVHAAAEEGGDGLTHCRIDACRAGIRCGRCRITAVRSVC